MVVQSNYIPLLCIFVFPFYIYIRYTIKVSHEVLLKMIEQYSDCLFNTVILQGRTYNQTLIKTVSCLGFQDCTQKFCEMANNSMVDMTCLLLESSNTEMVYYYNNNIMYLLVSIILFLLIVLIVLSLVLYFTKKNLVNMNHMLYGKVSNIHHVDYDFPDKDDAKTTT